jgi:hypothetical protein
MQLVPGKQIISIKVASFSMELVSIPGEGQIAETIKTGLAGPGLIFFPIFETRFALYYSL